MPDSRAPSEGERRAGAGSGVPASAPAPASPAPAAPSHPPAAALSTGRRLTRPVRHASNLSTASSLSASSPLLSHAPVAATTSAAQKDDPSSPSPAPAAPASALAPAQPSIAPLSMPPPSMPPPAAAPAQAPAPAVPLARQASSARRSTLDRPRAAPAAAALPARRSPSATRARHGRQPSSTGLAAPWTEGPLNPDQSPALRPSPTLRTRDLPPLGTALSPPLPPQRSMSINVAHGPPSDYAGSVGSPSQSFASGTSLPRFWGVPHPLAHSPSVSVGGPDGVDPDFIAAVSGLTPATAGAPTSVTDSVSPMVPSALPSAVPFTPSGAAAYHSATGSGNPPVSAGSGSGSGSWSGSHDEPPASGLLSPAQVTPSSMPSSTAPFFHHYPHPANVHTSSSPSHSLRHPGHAHVHSTSHLGSTPSSTAGSPAHLGLGLSDHFLHLRPSISPTLAKSPLPDMERSPDRRGDGRDESDATPSSEMRLQKVPAHVHRAGDLFNPSPLPSARLPSALAASSSGVGTPTHERGSEDALGSRSRSSTRSRSSSSALHRSHSRHPPPTPRGSRNPSPERDAVPQGDNDLLLAMAGPGRSATSSPASWGRSTPDRAPPASPTRSQLEPVGVPRAAQSASGLSLSRDGSSPPPLPPVKGWDLGTIRASGVRQRSSTGAAHASTSPKGESSLFSPPADLDAVRPPESTSYVPPSRAQAATPPPALAASTVARTTTPSPPTTATTLAVAVGVTGDKDKPGSRQGSSPRTVPAAMPIPRTSPTHPRSPSHRGGLSLSPIESLSRNMGHSLSQREASSPSTNRRASLTPLFISPSHRAGSPIRKHDHTSALLPTPANSPEASDEEEESQLMRPSSRSSATIPPPQSPKLSTLGLAAGSQSNSSRGREVAAGSSSSRATSPADTFKRLRHRQSNAALGPLFSLPPTPSQTRLARPLHRSRPSSGSVQNLPGEKEKDGTPSEIPTGSSSSTKTSSSRTAAPLAPPPLPLMGGAGPSLTGPSPWIESSVHARELPSLARQPTRPAESFAHVILRSRASKMRQWKGHQPRRTGSLSSVSSGSLEKGQGDKALLAQPRSVPRLRSSGSFTNARTAVGGSPSIPTVASGANTPAALQDHIAWVDWMDEYERFKRSRLLMQQRKRGNVGNDPEGAAQDAPSSKPAKEAAAPLVGSAPRRPSAIAMPPPGGLPAAGQTDQQGFLIPSLPTPDAQRRAASMPGAIPSAPSASVPASSVEPIPAPTPSPTSEVGSTTRNLKGQVEAWWSAVKSGFNGARPLSAKAPPRPLGSLSSPLGSAPAAPRSSEGNERTPVSSAGAVLRGEVPTSGVSYYSGRGSPRTQSGALAPSRLSYSTDVAPSDVDSDADNKASSHGSKPASLRRTDSARNSPLTRSHGATVLSDPFATPHRSVTSRVQGVSPASKQSPSDTPGCRSGSDSAKSPSTSPVVQKLGFKPRPSPTLSGSTPASPGSVGATSQRVPSGSLTDPSVQEGEDFIITVMWQTIRHRLQSSKKACDAGLRRVVAEVNEFVEEQLHPPPPETDDEDDGDAEDCASDFSSPDEDKVMNLPPDSALFAPPGMEAEYQARVHQEQEREGEMGSPADPDETAHASEAVHAPRQESPERAKLGRPAARKQPSSSESDTKADSPSPRPIVSTRTAPRTQSHPEAAPRSASESGQGNVAAATAPLRAETPVTSGDAASPSDTKAKPPQFAARPSQSVQSRPAPPNRSGTLVPSDHGPISNLSSNPSSSGGTPGDLTPARLPTRAVYRPRLPWARQDLPVSGGVSSTTSRSTSRSHSPTRLASAAYAQSPHLSPARRVRSEEPLADLPYVPVLQQLVVLAVEMIDTSLTTLTQRSGMCSEIISKLQALGQTWDAHPDWPGRGWYVDVLLHVASLSRVTEWWTAEKADWQGLEGLEESGQDKDARPVRFFLRPRKDQRDGSRSGSGAESGDARSSVGVRGQRSQELQKSVRHHGSGSSRGGDGSPLGATTDSSKKGGHRRTRGSSKSIRVASGEGRASGQGKEARETKAHIDANVLMELGLDGDEILYLNPAWSSIIGADAAQYVQTSISPLLAEADADTFRTATQELLAHPAHTIEVLFRLRLPQVAPVLDKEGNVVQEVALFQRMEGKGMLMHDRATGEKTHTMWVFKPTSPPEPEEALVMRPQAGGVPIDQHLVATLHMSPIMCRICERLVPAFFFEKHSEICNEIHRLEMEIGERNETLQELRRNTQSIITAIDNPSEGHELPEYHGIKVNTPPPSLQPPSALEGLNRSLSLRQTQPALVRKAHARALDGALHALITAAAISTPAVKDEQDDMPTEEQQLLSPSSEEKAFEISTWVKPQVEDAALDALFTDAEMAIRSKLNGVNRMINTIVYCETVRKEWEARAESLLETMTDTATNAGGDEDEPPPVTPGTVASNAPAAQQYRDSFSTVGRDSVGNMDDLLGRTGGLLLDDRADMNEGFDTASPASAAPNRTGHGDHEVPPMEEGMMSESISNLAAIPIPSSSHNNSPRPESVGSAASHQAYLSPAHALGPRSSFAGEHSPSRGDAFSASFSPQSLAPEGQSWLGHRPFSLSHSHSRPSGMSGSIPISPRLPSIAPASRPTCTTIKDFKLIKPISKGAFGAVYLVQKRTTGDYFAMKVLKKSDMIAKNQASNVKAERQILMTQTQSPFVVKLFFTFNDSDNLYLVMEYLPGGDLASLVKTLGPLGLEWTTQYVAEIVNGIDSLHVRGIVHRDLKPDNVLIDMKGHLKLTDFGLSKIGLLGRQQDQRTAVVSVGSGLRKASWAISAGDSVSSSPDQAQGSGFSQVGVHSPSHLHRTSRGNDVGSDTNSSDGGFLQSASQQPRRMESPQHPLRRLQVVGKDSDSTPNSAKHFVGTPDYLAPESILGFGMDDMTVDWWALGVMLYEFMYGIPPFHAPEVDKVFDNILSRRLQWMPEEDEELGVTPVVKDLIEKLLTSDPHQRLGANGAAEVKAHPFFKDIDWDNLTTGEGPFVPQVDNPESTDYFDSRGAQKPDFETDQAREEFGKAIDDHHQRTHSRENDEGDTSADQFGSFRFKNLPVLKQANDEVVRKMRVDSQAVLPNLPGSPISETFPTPPSPPKSVAAGSAVTCQSPVIHPQTQQPPPPPMAPSSSFAQRHRNLSTRTLASHVGRLSLACPASPSGSASSQGSNPSRSTAPTSPAVAAHAAHRRVEGYQPSVLSTTRGSPGSSTAGNAASFGTRRFADSPLLAPISIGGSVTEQPIGLQSPFAGLSNSNHKRNLSIGSNASERPGLSPLHGLRRSESEELHVSPGEGGQELARHQSEGSLYSHGSFDHTKNAALPDDEAMEEMQSDGEGSRSRCNSDEEDSHSSSSGRSSTSTVRCLIGEDNPIAQSMLESVLTKFGCECVCVKDGSSVITAAMGDLAFVIIFVDLTLPVVDGQDAARMIKSTRNINSNVPMVALASVEQAAPYFPEGIDREAVLSGDERVGVLELSNSVFNAIITKPLETADVVELINRLGIRAADQSNSPDRTIQDDEHSFSSDSGDLTTVVTNHPQRPFEGSPHSIG